MKIQKDDLQKALETVKPGLASSEIIEQSTSFAFLGDRVVTYNDSISLSHPIEGLDLEGAIRAEELYEFLKRTKEDTLQLRISENELKLKCGKAKAGLKLQTEIKLPLQEVDQVKDWEDLPEEFADNLSFIKDSASQDMSRRVLTCAHVTNRCMETSDSFQIMRLHQEGWPFGDYLIPAENIPEITKINPTLVAESEGWLHFKNLEGTELSCRILEDSYPDAGQHLDVGGEKVIFPESMNEILDRVMVFTKKDHYMDEAMQVILKDNKLLVHGKNEYGWIKEKAKVKYEGDKASFWITPHLLKNILSRSNECILGEEKIKFEGEDWEYVAVLRED